MKRALLVKQESNLEAFPNMPRTLTYEELVEAVEKSSFIKNGVKESAEGIKYDFRMGSRVLKASKHGAVDMDEMSQTEQNEMVVEPGEVVFVLTEETLELPNTLMAHLVPKRKLSHEGIIVLGGFCIDPLYNGKLLVGLYNFSSTPFSLKPRRKLIAAVFYELQGNEIGTVNKPEATVTDFPDDLEKFIHSYQPIDLKGLRENITNLDTQIQDLRNEIITDKQWKRDFQGKLDQQSERIDKILSGLEKENETRTATEKTLNEQIAALRVTQGQATTQYGTNFVLLVALATFVVTAALTIAGVLFTISLTKTEPPPAVQIQSQPGPQSQGQSQPAPQSNSSP